MPTSSPAAAVGPRLSVMMFLQFFVWGSWYVSVGNYIKRVGWGEDTVNQATSWAYTVGPIAAIVSPLFLGVVADRLFATQRVLGVLHLLGAAFMFAIPLLAGSGAESEAPLLIGLLAGHMLCFMPTLGLTNTLAFHQLTDQERQFPMIRLFGTIGWIVANRVTSNVLEADYTATQFYAAGIAGVLLGVYSFSLPHTPPPMRGKKARIGELLGLDALQLLRDRSFAVFIVASFLICIPLAGYYAWAQSFVGDMGYEAPAGTMSWGQVAEVLFMLAMPVCFARLGVKWMLAVGMLAWVLRYVMFGFAADDGTQWLVLGGILLHGICYDFFFVTGQIWVDKAAPARIRGQAQGFLVLVTQGLGLGIGAQAFGQLVAAHKEDGVIAWGPVWYFPAAFAGVVLVLFVLTFSGRAGRATLDEVSPPS